VSKGLKVIPHSFQPNFFFIEKLTPEQVQQLLELDKTESDNLSEQAFGKVATPPASEEYFTPANVTKPVIP
jgi:hypothetical protein